MAEPISFEQEKRLAEQLKAEARLDRPSFSEALHGRIVRSIEEAPAPPRPRSSTAWLGHPWLSVAVAATVLVGGLVVAWRIQRVEEPVAGPSPNDFAETHVPESVAPAPETPEIEAPQPDPSTDQDPLEGLAGDVAPMVDLALTEPQWAYLDHDMKLAANLLMDQLPFELALAESQPQ
jgi:hypothetical protein